MERNGVRKVGILEPDNFSDKALLILKKYYVVELYYEGDLSDFISDKFAIFIRLRYKIDDSLIRKAKNLQYICTPTTGLNHVSVSDKMKIISLKGEFDFLMNIRATPEHSFGLAIALLRNYKRAFLNMKNSMWNRDLYRGEELYQKIIAIIGLGRVGTLLAQYYTCFGANVIYYDIRKELNKNYQEMDSMESAIKSADIVHLCINYTVQNAGIINYKILELLDGKYFINTSRGEVIKEDDLLQYIDHGKYKGIALDVISNEFGDNCLDEFLKVSENKNIIITPHISGATRESMEKTEIFIANKLLEKDNA